MQAFNVGDKVQLKSGGPVMTVESVSSGNVTCLWFAGSESKCQAFPAATLEPFSDVVARRAPVWVR